ncbi:hypothetical protein OsJ_06470 [Oryza sativa Japonica Group]|uniref:Uncharacterized protein n=1 Tax=Oryza sativa subsp. japonica TaxID=39947 RepID=B9F5C2_ORYSJ|nr:hypothetical protein OsJ_06470 [Oryza sativa Japonica Group]
MAWSGGGEEEEDGGGKVRLQRSYSACTREGVDGGDREGMMYRRQERGGRTRIWPGLHWSATPTRDRAVVAPGRSHRRHRHSTAAPRRSRGRPQSPPPSIAVPAGAKVVPSRHYRRERVRLREAALVIGHGWHAFRKAVAVVVGRGLTTRGQGSGAIGAQCSCVVRAASQHVGGHRGAISCLPEKSVRNWNSRGNLNIFLDLRKLESKL